MAKKTKRPIKVLHAPFNFANQPYVLSQALRARGIDSHVLRYQWEHNPGSSKFDYKDDRVAQISRKDWFGDLLRNVQNVAAEEFDIVHFWNRSLLWRQPNAFYNGIDLPFLRLAGARLVYRFTGYELRRKSLELQVNPFTPYRYGFENRFNEDDQKRYLDYLAPYVDEFVVQDPEMQTYCPHACLIPRALDLEEFPVLEPAQNMRPLVVHAPSNQSVKGSEFIIKAADILKEEGLKFDFVLIENMPNAEAIEQYRRADIIIDQLLIGWYGVLSMEGMAMEKTVIAYIREDLTGYFGKKMPLVNANPETITAVLRNAIKDREMRREIGLRARAFIEEVHDSRVVARSAARLYKKMLKVPASRMIPDFSYQLGHSSSVGRILLAPDPESILQRKFDELRTDYDALEISHKAAGSEALKVAALTEEIALLRGKVERYNEVERELPALRHGARRYEELKPELPALRYKSKRYDELKDEALVWRTKADRFDRIAAKRWVKFVLPLLGLPIGFKSRRAHQPAAPKSGASGQGRMRTSSGDAAGEASEGDPGLKQPDIASTPMVDQNASSSSSKGLVCIVTRKPIRNVTRAPRMAKALVDVGYEVVVVSTALPVPQLQQMCSEVKYIALAPQPYTNRSRDRWRERQRKRHVDQRRREECYQAELVKGGLRSHMLWAGRAATASLKWLCWRIFVVTPCAPLLTIRRQGFLATWRELANEDAIQVAIRFVMVPQQRAASYSLAEEADKATHGRRFDVVQAYDNFALVAAARLAARDGAKLVYDAVELASFRVARDPNLVERIRDRLDRREEASIIRRSDAVITVSDGLADWYARHCRIPRPLVVRNCRYYWPYKKDDRLRADAGIGPEVRLLVWCGDLYPQQGIEFLIEALSHLAPSVHLTVVAIVRPMWKKYRQEVLPRLINSLGIADRVHILPPRGPNDLVPYISGAEIGVIPAWGEQVNNLVSLPNKFHEMVMARLPLASSRLGATVDMINQYEIGAIFEERDLVRAAAIIEGMLEPSTYARLKANVMKAAETLTWEKESAAYVELVQFLMPPQFRAAASAGPSKIETNRQPVPQQIPSTVEATTATPKKPTPTASASDRRLAVKGIDLSEENTKLRATNEKIKAAYLQAAEANGKLRDAVVSSREIGQFYRDSTSVNHYLRLARYCYERAGEIKAEAYLAHGVEALPAADAVAKAVGGRVYCDVIEMPSFTQRSVTYDLHPTSHSLLDHAFDGYLRGAAGLSTVGWELCKQLQHYGPRVTVIPNYRNSERLQRSDQIREKCGLGSEQRLLLASSTIASGLDPIIEALKLLPDNVHLATLGVIFRNYRSTVEAAVQRSGVASRVHFLDPVPYDQLATVASGADIGLMAIDPSLMHWQISLPNRLFDCIAAGLPIVTPDVPDITRIVAGRKIGIALAQNDARSWADGIMAALAGEAAMRANVFAASEALVWESLGDKLHAAYDHAASIAIIAFTSLIGHQRTIRMADTLVKRGVKVTICCPHEGPVPADEMPGVSIVLTPRPLPDTSPAKPPAAFVSPVPTAAARNATSPTKANGAAAAQPTAVPANGARSLALSALHTPQIPSNDEAALERLKKEVIELRYKARRYDEVKAELPAWRAKADRYDRLKGNGGGTLLASFRRGLRFSASNGNVKGEKRGPTPLGEGTGT